MISHTPNPLFRPAVLATHEGAMRGAKFVLAALALGCASQSLASSSRGPSPTWSRATGAVPELGSQRANNLRLDGNRSLWNGRDVPEANVRAFLDVTAMMSPHPVLILSYSTRTPRERVERTKLLVDEIVRCTPAKCLEVTASSH